MDSPPCSSTLRMKSQRKYEESSMKRLVTLCAAILALVLAATIMGCGGGNSSAGLVAVSPVPSGGRVVTNNVTDIEEWDAVKALTPGTVVQIRLNRNSFEVREYDAVLQNVDSSWGENIVVCRMMNGVVVGNGDSGSPVLHNGKVIAVLCYGLAAGDNLTFGARAIRDEIALSGDIQTRDAKANTKTRSFGNQQFVPMGLVKFNTMKGTPLIKTAGTRAAAPTLIPGMSIAVCELSGSAYVGAIGTVTYIDGNKVYAFGHAYNLNGDGNATPVYIASMQCMGDGGAAGASKLASPTDVQVGSLTNDQYTGILIQKDVASKTYPVTIKVKVNGQQKGDVVEKFAVHNWQTIGTGWDITSEQYNVAGVTGWALSRQVGIVAPGTATGTFKIKYPGADEISDTISLPKVDSTSESTDIAYEASNEFSNLLTKYQQNWMSPENVTITVDITTGSSSDKVYAQIIDKNGNAITADDQKVYHVVTGDYQVKAWVPGWTKYKVTRDSPGELNPLTITSGGFTAVAPGTATVNITVTNLITNEQKTLDPALSIQVEGDLPPGGAG